MMSLEAYPTAIYVQELPAIMVRWFCDAYGRVDAELDKLFRLEEFLYRRYYNEVMSPAHDRGESASATLPYKEFLLRCVLELLSRETSESPSS